ncbi:hypothetical protein CXB49_04585 [Chromobacterium sp. ATCC 53434]|uniref:substrate-binding domain-containing protein n=1 Tax=Chromobacterium sp. (strain ATCC 53434 / SC 14030) TaxID=2059672 RepID=UPI000C766075|nr:substrate-binding domain-containing protein [Chromobacterium sp. ATCC 53434]AUH50147.1 hypothetical protein CXB49_04585 [Chromobacterium sp. ATCC 53434]
MRRLGPVSRWWALPLALALLAALALAARPWRLRPAPVSLVIAGSSQLQALLRDLADDYDPGGGIVVEGGGSIAGLVAAQRGVVDLAAVSQTLPEWRDDMQSHYHLLARNSIAFVVNRASPLRALSQRQLRDVLTGRIANWRQLDGRDAPIRLLGRREPSPTRQFVVETVLAGREPSWRAETLDSAAQMTAEVARDPLALGYLSLQEAGVGARLTLLTIDGVPFSRATILSGRYPYAQDLYLVSRDDAALGVGPLLAWLKSPPAQEAIERHQLISVY